MHSKNITFFVLVLAVCLTQFASDIYAPAIPAIATSLSTNVDYAQFSMSTYMCGVAISQLVYGPLSEGIGRKAPLVIGLFIMILGSSICLAPNIDTLIFGRFIQGVGAGSCAALWRSIFRDQFTGEDLAKYGSYIVIFIMFIVPSAPIVGGYLEQFFGWQANFVFMMIYSIVALVAIILGFSETNKHYHISKLGIKPIFNNYLILLKSPLFIGITLSTFLTYGANFSWFVAGSILLIDEVGVDPVVFGWLTFFCAGVPYGIAGYLNGKLVKYCGMPFMMRLGWCLMIIAGLTMTILNLLFEISEWTLMPPIALSFFGSTFIWPNAFATAFSPFGHIAGYAGALYGFMQIAGGATLAAIVAYLPDDSPLILSSIITICASGALITYEFTARAAKL